MLSGASLDLLWSAQLGLANLVKCMPSDLWEEKVWRYPWSVPGCNDRVESDLRLMIRRPMLPGDWTRFHFYAQRVRKLTLDNNWKAEGHLSNEDLMLLGLFAPSSPLLPNLRKLETKRCSSPVPLELFLKLPGPKLTHLEMVVSDSDKVTNSVLTHLPTLVPNLRVLELYQHKTPSKARLDPRECFSFPSGALRGLKHLEKLAMFVESPLSHQAFVELSSLPQLSSLEWDVEANIDQFVMPFRGSEAHGTPSALENIRTWSYYITSSLGLLKAKKWPKLENIQLTAAEAGCEDLTTICQTIRDQCSVSTLKHVSIQFEKEESADNVPGVSLQPLYAFHGLESLTIDSEYNIELQDADLEEMALAWPGLQDLAFVHDEADSWVFTPAATLGGLVHLVKYCPNLRHIVLDVNASRTEISPGAKPGGGWCNTMLTEIGLGPSSIAGDPHKIAKYLSDLFPNLESIDCDAEDPRHRAAWEEAERHLPAFAATRTAQRAKGPPIPRVIHHHVRGRDK
ncbi:predicted protein [Postia placenta Mad-698-R]|nr:predicted protein [Postia placenta Mad-698-R]